MSDSSFNWEGPSFLRTNRKDPYLALQQVNIFVRDQDRSKTFYMDQLGFTLAYEASLESGNQWIAVAPPDGTAILALVTAKPDSDEYKLIGGQSQVVFLAEDIHATFRAWSERGVHFHHEPQVPGWGGMFTSFEDVDGNVFGLVGFDDATRHLARQRRAFAEKLESDRRAAQEIEIAKQFQTRLFPQTLPPLRTLEYAGVCIQARQVGGDYYDFLDLGRDRLGLVVGDISGKGIAAALLMANLQANLRSQIINARDQPQQFLRSVNQLFFENTTDNAYATLFFAEYDDKVRRLRYANCGHLSALLLHNDDSIERLDSTGTVLGLFKDWDCSIREGQLSSGDILALYTDGITESLNADGEEFGEERLLESVRRNRQLSPSDLLTTIVDEVKQFSALEQHDDITLIVAKCRE